jgi:hypothetical protein
MLGGLGLLKSPTSVMDSDVMDLFTTPVKRKMRVILDIYNKCAKTILDHQRERSIWKQRNFIDDLVVNTKLYDVQHYLVQSGKSTAKFGNGSLIRCLEKMRLVRDLFFCQIVNVIDFYTGITWD